MNNFQNGCDLKIQLGKKKLPDYLSKDTMATNKTSDPHPVIDTSNIIVTMSSRIDMFLFNF